MFTKLLFDVLLWFVETVLALVDFAIPESFMSLAGDGLGIIASAMSYGPLGLVGGVILTWMAIDTSLNAFVFAVQTYRLIPAKAT